jgi:hypothetical protein
MNIELRSTLSSQSVTQRVVKVTEPTLSAAAFKTEISEGIKPTAAESLRD